VRVQVLHFFLSCALNMPIHIHPPKKNSSCALQVAIVERFEESLRLLETLLPSVFGGIGSLFHEQGSSRVNTKHIPPSARRSLTSTRATVAARRRLRENADPTQNSTGSHDERATTPRTAEWSKEVDTFIKDKLHFEQSFYDRMLKRFNRQISSCGHSKS
jgi:hypothetical protein